MAVAQLGSWLTAGTVAATTAAGAASAAAALIGASTIATVVGGTVSAIGAIKEGKAQRAQANYEAKVADNNALSAGYQAVAEQEAASREADTLRDRYIRTMGQQTAAAAASGLQISGSITDVMLDSTIQSEQDVLMARYSGRIGAYRSGQEAKGFREQAGGLRRAGKQMYKSAQWKAGSTLLASASQTGLQLASFGI
jgi:hypothetical protein